MKTAKKTPVAGVSEIPAKTKLKVHPLAGKFPMLDVETLEGMKRSIEMVGQQHPGVLDQDGVLLDGRMRKHCCDELKKPFKVQTRTFATDLEREQFILASNKDRRLFGLDQSAALIVDRYFDQYEADAKQAMVDGGAKGGSAKNKGKVPSPNPSPKPSNSVRERFHTDWTVSDHRAKLAIRLFKDGHDLLEEVIVGKLTLNQAIKALDKRNKAPKKKATKEDKPNGGHNAVERVLSQEEDAAIQALCADLADAIDQLHEDTDSRNEADIVVENYFRQRRVDRQDGANGEAAADE